MKKLKKRKKRKGRKPAVLLLFLFLMIGLAGGFLVKTVLYEKVGKGIMSNQEANRLISYLGLSDYTYTDRLGSSFTAESARKLLDAAKVPVSSMDVWFQHMPGWLPVSREQFGSMYDVLIEKLELSRLYSTSLYIADIDSANDREINGILYEIVSTSDGDYFMEKEYGLDRELVGRVADFYVSNNEIILCLGESEKEVVLPNAYAVKMLEDNGKEQLQVYLMGKRQELKVAKHAGIKVDPEGMLCDVRFSNKGVTGLESHDRDLVTAKVTSYSDQSVIVEGYEDPLYLSESFNVYKLKGTFKAAKSAGILVGYDSVSLLIRDGLLEAALITEDIYSKNIRVLISDSEFASYYHNSVMLTSDTDYTVTYGDQVKECKAGEYVELRTGSAELKEGSARVQSKEENGRIRIMTIERQNGNPSYRGVLEFTKNDKGICIVNELPVEEYLYGVVPSEMPVSYETEALKAQAICARAYACRQMESDAYAEYGADLDDSVASQVYNNIDENERSNFAVDDTYGIVPCYEGQVAETFFFSTSCGSTSSNSEVWGGTPEPYLLDTMETELNDLAELGNEESFRKFIDGSLGGDFIEQQEPFFRWKVEFTDKEMQEAIEAHLYERIQAMGENILAKNASGSFEKKPLSTIGELQSIQVTLRGDSGIIQEMLLTGSEETVQVKGQANARALFSPELVGIEKQDGSIVKGWKGLPSAYFYIEKTEKGYTLHGGGFGHGVGMSQNGANDLAKLGYGAGDIISHYYTGVELFDMYQVIGKNES